MGRHSDRAGRASGARAAVRQAPARIVDVHDVSVSYGDVAALRGVSFSAVPGDFVAVTGADYTGKVSLSGLVSFVLETVTSAPAVALANEIGASRPDGTEAGRNTVGT